LTEKGGFVGPPLFFDTPSLTPMMKYPTTRLGWVIRCGWTIIGLFIGIIPIKKGLATLQASRDWRAANPKQGGGSSAPGG
jgi:hypothetical protein